MDRPIFPTFRSGWRQACEHTASLPDRSWSVHHRGRHGFGVRPSIHIELTTNHLDKRYEELKARGVEFFEPPHEEAWKRSMRAAHDPDGYTVEVAEGRRGH